MNAKQLTFTLLFCLSALLIFAQKKPPQPKHPYEISLKKDLPLLGLGIGLKITGEILKRNVNPLTPQAIQALDAAQLNAFDRSATENYSRTARDFSDVFQYGSYGFSLLLLLDQHNRSDYLKIGTMGVQVWLINSGLTDITKSLIKRPRPFMYNSTVDLETKTKNSSRLSFYSGHTSKVASMSFFTAQLFSDYYPQSKWKGLVWTTAVILPATTGYLRYRGGKHFPTDVITGLAAGALVGLVIPRLHRKITNNKLSLSVLPTADGISFVMSW